MSRVVVCGSLNMDVIVESARRPHAGETLLGAKVSFLPGGKGLNQAVAAARLGASTAMLGAIGHDAFGNTLRGFLADNDVDSSGVRALRSPRDRPCPDPGRRGRQRDHRGIRRQPALHQWHGAARPHGDEVWVAQFETPVETTQALLMQARQPAPARC